MTLRHPAISKKKVHIKTVFSWLQYQKQWLKVAGS